MEGQIELTKYIVYYFNRFANQTQTFKVLAKNEFRAGRLFYLKHNRKAYKGCIETITGANDHFWTEDEIRTHIKKYQGRIK
jgi:hypothetical protein